MMRKKKSRKSERNYMKLDEEKKIESSKRHLPSKIPFPVPLKPLHSYEIERQFSAFAGVRQWGTFEFVYHETLHQLNRLITKCLFQRTKIAILGILCLDVYLTPDLMKPSVLMGKVDIDLCAKLSLVRHIAITVRTCFGVLQTKD